MDDQKRRVDQAEALLKVLSAKPPVKFVSSRLTADQKLWELLEQPSDILGLSTRTRHALLSDLNNYVIESIVRTPEKSMAGRLGMGKKSLQELKDRLKDRGLSLGMALEPAISTTIIHEPCEDGNGRVLSSGMILNFPTCNQAVNFYGEIRPFFGKDEADIDFIYHNIRNLPIQQTEGGKRYPVYVSDAALDTLTKVDNLRQLDAAVHDVSVVGGRI